MKFWLIVGGTNSVSDDEFGLFEVVGSVGGFDIVDEIGFVVDGVESSLLKFVSEGVLDGFVVSHDAVYLFCVFEKRMHIVDLFGSEVDFHFFSFVVDDACVLLFFDSESRG